MKTIACSIFISIFALLVMAADSKPSASSRQQPGTPQPDLSPSAEDVIRERQAAYHIIEAILVSPELTFKMPVLSAAFLDTPEWEQRLQQIINREHWEFAKLTFIHFYWKRVSKKDPEFMQRMLDYARLKNQEFHLGQVDEMLEAEKR